MATSDTEKRRHGHKHKKHSHHHKSHHHMSHRHASHERSSTHGHHHRHKRKHRRHHARTKITLDQDALQSAVKLLESEALEAARDSNSSAGSHSDTRSLLSGHEEEGGEGSVKEKEIGHKVKEKDGTVEKDATVEICGGKELEEIGEANVETAVQTSSSNAEFSLSVLHSGDASKPDSSTTVKGTFHSQVQEEDAVLTPSSQSQSSEPKDIVSSSTMYETGALRLKPQAPKTIRISIRSSKLPQGDKDRNQESFARPIALEEGLVERSASVSEIVRDLVPGTPELATGEVTQREEAASSVEGDSPPDEGRGGSSSHRRGERSRDGRETGSLDRRRTRRRGKRTGQDRSSCSSSSGGESERARVRGRARDTQPSKRRRRHSGSRSPPPRSGRRYRSRSYSPSPRQRKRSRSHSRHRRYSRYQSSRHRTSRSRSSQGRVRRDRRGRRSYSRSRSRSRSPYRKRRQYDYRSRRNWSRSSLSSWTRSRSRSHSHRRRDKSHSRSHSHQRRSTSRSQSRSSSCQRNDEADAPQLQSVAVMPTRAEIAEFIGVCRNLQERQEVEDRLGPEEDTTSVEPSIPIRAPFELKPSPVFQPGLVLHNNAWKTPNQIVAEANRNDATKPVEELFPVSTGVVHMQSVDTPRASASDEAGSEGVFGPGHQAKPAVAMGELVVKRLEATQRLQSNPSDLEAQQALQYLEQQATVWAESQRKPGQFTGQVTLSPLTTEAHRAGTQAWAKKKMFHGLMPVVSSFGLKMMKKMGWQEGTPLGRTGEGNTVPIALDVKMDRLGLSTESDKTPAIVPASALQMQASDSKAAHLINGKHPVSALQEICAKKKWKTPLYEPVNDTGPAHMKSFLCRVTVPLGSFQPVVGSATKKQAKAQAALACLQGLGFVDNAINYTAS